MKLGDVLFPTDFSAASEMAWFVAKELARQQGARLHIVHVVPPVTDPGDSADNLGILAAALGDIRVETALLSGRVAHQIVRYARDKGISLIVLGTHGRTGVSHAILGSVAESVVRLAPCPVLTVPGSLATAGAPKGAAAADEGPRSCIVCARETDDLVCEPCRARIRGESLEKKLEAERPGRRGSPV